jgi:uncharacterized membrane protein
VTSRAARNLSLFLATAGVTHFVVPTFYDRIVPPALPLSARFWTQASGAAELACAAAVMMPKTRRTGALLAALLFMAVFPANVQMAIDYRDHPRAERAIAYARLPLQIPLIWWALRVRRTAAA